MLLIIEMHKFIDKQYILFRDSKREESITILIILQIFCSEKKFVFTYTDLYAASRYTWKAVAETTYSKYINNELYLKWSQNPSSNSAQRFITCEDIEICQIQQYIQVYKPT